MSDQYSVQEALLDIQAMKRAMSCAKSNESQSNNDWYATAILQAGAASTSFILLGIELFYKVSLTDDLIFSKYDRNYQYIGLASVALALLYLSAAFLFLLKRAAQKQQESFENYVARNFSYLKNLSLFSDLIIKFVLFAVLILIGKQELIAGLLLLFTGDYLLQGRFFTLSLRTSIMWGISCVAGAVWMFIYNYYRVDLPLAVFTAVAVASAVSISKGRK